MERNDGRVITPDQKERLLPTIIYGAIGHGYQPSRYIYLPEGTYSDKSHMDIRRPKGQPYVEFFNDQILRECYRPLLADTKGGIPPGLVFSYYTTLREWLRADHPDIYQTVRENIKRLPDKEYQVLGDPFLHVIMPFFNADDQRMLLEMGKMAFKEDNGFVPKGLWLPETAVSKQTLQVAQEAGYEFVMLRDHQLEGVGSGRISRYKTDKNPVYQRLHNGREIAIVHFDSEVSGDIAFDGGKTNRVEDFFNFAASKVGAGDTLLTGVDLETYGHHKKGKENFLRESLRAAASGNYNDFLQREWHQQPVGYNIQPFSVRKQLQQKEKTYDTVLDGSSWSCANGHDLGRWKGTCDCDNPSWEARKDKMRFFSTLSSYNNQINNTLDQRYKGWRSDFAKKTVSLRSKILSGQNFLPDLQKISGERYSLYAAKLYTLLGFTSCGWFFGGTSSIERDLPKDMIAATEKMLFPQQLRREKAS